MLRGQPSEAAARAGHQRGHPRIAGPVALDRVVQVEIDMRERRDGRALAEQAPQDADAARDVVKHGGGAILGDDGHPADRTAREAVGAHIAAVDQHRRADSHAAEHRENVAPPARRPEQRLGPPDGGRQHADLHGKVELRLEPRAERERPPSHVGRLPDLAGFRVHLGGDHDEPAEQAARVRRVRRGQAPAFGRQALHEPFGVGHRLELELGAGDHVPSEIRQGDGLDGGRNEDPQHLAAARIDGERPRPPARPDRSFVGRFRSLVQQTGLDHAPGDARHLRRVEPDALGDLPAGDRSPQHDFPEEGAFAFPASFAGRLRYSRHLRTPGRSRARILP